MIGRQKRVSIAIDIIYSPLRPTDNMDKKESSTSAAASPTVGGGDKKKKPTIKFKAKKSKPKITKVRETLHFCDIILLLL